VDERNKLANNFLEKNLGVELVEVKIPQIEAGGGGPRYATRDIY